VTRAFSGFNVFGYVSGNLGIGVTARNLLQLFDHIGLPFAVIDIDPGLGRGGYDLTWQDRTMKASPDLPHQVNLIVLPPGDLASFNQTFPFLFNNDRYFNVAFSMWELPVLQRAHVVALEQMDLLVAESHFIQQTFQAHLPSVPCLYAPHPLFLPGGMKPDRTRFGFGDDETIFLTSFEPNSDVARKNPWAVLTAFEQAFTPPGYARLVIKTNNARLNGKPHPALAELRQRIAGNPSVSLLEASLSYADVLSLYASADVLVSLHRSEGLGLSPMEAMRLGKAVIATGWSGNMTYMDHTNSAPVRYRLIPADGSLPVYQRQNYDLPAVWADADLEDAVTWMRRLYDIPALREEVGARAAADLAAFQQDALQARFVDEIHAAKVQKFDRTRLFPAPTLPQQQDEAAVDVVIPVYGHPDLLQTCLDSLLATTHGAHIFVVDDCSPTDMESVYARYQNHPRITIIRRTENGGFIPATRQGADAGKAPYILFLNSDTECIRPGWLAAMLPDRDDVGVVGARLLYPPGKNRLSGSIQHTGIARGAQGRPYHPYMGWSPTTAGMAMRSDTSADVNAVTGACLLVRRSVWNQLNGWEPALGRGVYEDVDFCWRVRAAGLRVLLQPQAVLYHHESASVDADGSHNLNVHTRQNWEWLHTRWSHLASDEDLFFGQAAAAARDSARALLTDVESSMKSGQYERALEFAAQAAAAAPDLPEARYLLGGLHFRQKQLPATIFHLGCSLRYNPTLWDAYLTLSDALSAAGLTPMAGQALAPVAGLFPAHPEVAKRATTLKTRQPAADPRYPRPAVLLDQIMKAPDLPAAVQAESARLDDAALTLACASMAVTYAGGDTSTGESLQRLAELILQSRSTPAPGKKKHHRH